MCQYFKVWCETSCETLDKINKYTVRQFFRKGKDKMDKNEFVNKLKIFARDINIDLSTNELDELFLYKNLIVDWNKKVNLTAITDDYDFIIKHLIDSLTINKYIEKNKKIIDIGTGAGFPGIPIKIINKESKITLFDSLNKRIKVLEDIINKIGLNNVELMHGRAEEVFRNNSYREKYDIATSRAVANLSVLSELMLPSVKMGGICICMKGNNAVEEVEEAQYAIKTLGGIIEKIDTITLPGLNLERNIIIIRKVKSTPKIYPRKAGTPQKKPLKK